MIDAGLPKKKKKHGLHGPGLPQFGSRIAGLIFKIYTQDGDMNDKSPVHTVINKDVLFLFFVLAFNFNYLFFFIL
jgi:hypothetical protein